MKTLGILMLFGLCTAIGLRAAAKKRAAVSAVLALERELSAFSDALDGGESSLPAIAQNGQGLLYERLRVYIGALSEGLTERIAAQKASEPFAPEPLHAAAQLFFCGLSACARTEIRQRITRMKTALGDAAHALEPVQKQAKLIRAVGVLCGAALAVLLI